MFPAINGIRLLVVLVVLICLRVQAADDATKSAAQSAGEKIGAEIMLQTNAVRQQRGLAKLQHNPQLDAAARLLADHMARTGAFGHEADGRTVAQRVDLQGYRWMFVAENIAVQQPVPADSAAAARQIMDRWLKSPPHLHNIMSAQAREIGVAIADTDNGIVYAVQVFASP